MKALRTVVVALALIVPAAPAQAALIGLLGGNYDPPPITDSGPFGFVNCQAALTADPYHPDDPRFTANDFCVFYNAFNNDPESDSFVPFEEIFSLDFLLTLAGDFLAAGDNLGVHPFSDLPFLANSDEFNPNGLSLSGGFITPGVKEFYLLGCEFNCLFEVEVNAVALVLRLGPNDGNFEDYKTSNLAVNGIAVPEPGTLLLLGPAAAALLMRRSRAGRRRNQRTK